ncbi:hypothetical protein [Micromonospora parathelypteridis]|uniref:Uncharacterized protein n=1 Tax=Micromonospora parathelypteridis TaxID=1839617 RepID=A0A840W075_9ACTN|nr:hypothetical protein [Micromonospora parathelypteridis]MBB5478220.1 hypothetical protein [Micromonospora parathelypteridis]GGO07381.1 hypothetical protein GCM10011576_11890 [Micromonospora parathelypteridis]
MPFTPPRPASSPPRATVHIPPATRDRAADRAPARTASRILPVALATLTVVALAGCGAPPELREPTAAPTRTAAPTTTGTGTAPATPPATAPPLGGVTPTPDAGLVATACRNGPTAERVVQLLRGRAGVLPANVRVQVQTGPLCAADWQFTLVEVTGHEELQVVTRGQPTAPALVTAGTDVCTIEVRATAPAAIRALACDAGPVTRPSA